MGLTLRCNRNQVLKKNNKYLLNQNKLIVQQIFKIVAFYTCENYTISRVVSPQLYEMDNIAESKAWMTTKYYTWL